jgi:hypothetical protein
MLRLIALVVAVVGLGCGGEKECAPRSGIYEVSRAYRDGNCGTFFVAEQAVMDDTTPPADRGCTGELTTSPDACGVTSERVDCGGVVWDGTIQWNADASIGKGTLTHEVTIPGNECHGTYEVTYTKL